MLSLFCRQQISNRGIKVVGTCTGTAMMAECAISSLFDLIYNLKGYIISYVINKNIKKLVYIFYEDP